MILALILSGLLHQPPEQALGSSAIDCDRDGATPEINACFALDLEAEEKRMQQYLQVAMERARESDEADRAFGGPSAQRGYLDAGQSAWKAYADIVCNGVDDAWKDGSIRTVMYLDCMIRMTRERTHVIWRDHLTYADSTPPVLPEPVRPVSADLRSGPQPEDSPSNPQN